MATTATPFLVIEAGGSAASLGVVAAAVLVSELIALLFGGVLADRFPRQKVMAGADLLQTVAVGLLALSFANGAASITLIAALSGARGLGLGLFLPASQGILPQIVDADDLVSANSVRRLVANVAQIAGAVAGGAIVGLWDAAPALLAMASAFAIGVVARFGMRLPTLAYPLAHAPESWFDSVRSGWRDFASRRWLWTVVVGFAVINAVYVGVLGVLGPLVVDERFAGGGTWGFVVAASGVGAALAAVGSYRWRPGRPLVCAIVSAALVAALPLSLATAALPLTALIGAVVTGVGIEVFGILWVTVVQQQIPREVLSRVSSIDAIGSFAISPVGPVLAAVAAASFGPTESLVGCALIVVAVCALLLFIPDVRSVRLIARGGSASIAA